MRSALIKGRILFAVPASQSIAATYPKLTRDADTQACAQAFNVARNVFASKAAELSEIPELSARTGAKVVWREVGFDETVFDHKTEDALQTYTQKTSEHGHKWLIVQTAFNWRGDVYSLYAIPPDTRTAPLIDGGAPPIIFQTNTGQTFAVYPDDVWKFLPDWHVFALNGAGGKDVCTIAFRPDVGKATDLLPAPVKLWADLLDATLGSGENEGSANYTVGIRTDVAKVWANVALRPWVTYPDTYNSRAEIDRGLKRWSIQAKSFAAIYAQIEASYPAAEDAMAQYYQAHFNKSAEEARLLARSALDGAYRSYFVFSKSQNQN
jgi:hypothetical protein